ncbi:hypothetical protein C8R45DRAFT_1005180 [Mycena sanguinolenta]|nr:hypothetical protein C8R45DRAFT_1005180 [Mycena sanguinolenta]
MKQVQVKAWGETPVCVSLPEPQPLPADSPLVQVRLLAAGLHQVVRARASGTHYSAQGLPHVVGTDGVGTTVPEGKLVYFSAMSPTGGSFADIVTVPKAALTELPSSADPVQVAGLGNPVLASWMGLATRVDHKLVPEAFTCLIIGATTLSGKAAVSVARQFGAGKVIGAARSVNKMEGLGLDGTVELNDADATKTDWAAALGADVVLDFLWGPQAASFVEALKPGKTVQYVQLGTLSGRDTPFPGDVLRAKDLILRGSGPGAWSFPQLGQESPKMIGAIATGKIQPHKFKEMKLDEIELALSQVY